MTELVKYKEVISGLGGPVQKRKKQSKLEEYIELTGDIIETANKGYQAFNYLKDRYYKSSPSRNISTKPIQIEVPQQLAIDMPQRSKAYKKILKKEAKKAVQQVVTRVGIGANRPMRKNKTNAPRNNNRRGRGRGNLVNRNSRGSYNNNRFPIGRTFRQTPVRTRINHTELVASVGMGSYSSTVNEINPGLNSMFNWLPGIAANFEKYHWDYLQFHFESRTAYSVSGQIGMAIIYDAEHSPTALTTSFDAIYSLEGAVHGDVKKNHVLTLNQKNVNYLATGTRRKTLFVRMGALQADDDKMLYDPGIFVLATEGDTVATIGNIFVSYGISFFDAIPFVSPISTFLYSSTGAASVAAPLASATEQCLNVPGIKVSDTTYNWAIDFVGEYMVKVVGTTIASPILSFTGGSWTQDVAVINAGANTGIVCGYINVQAGTTTTLAAINAATCTQLKIIFTGIRQNTVTPSSNPMITAPTLKSMHRQVDERRLQVVDRVLNIDPTDIANYNEFVHNRRQQIYEDEVEESKYHSDGVKSRDKKKKIAITPS